MAVSPRRHPRDLPACAHGSLGPEERRSLGPAGGDVIDFSASCNPLGASPAVGAALAALDVSRYPDNRATELREAVASYLVASHLVEGRQGEPGGLPPPGLHASFGPDWIAVGNGSVELMWLLAYAYLEPGDRTLVVGPTFGEYARACLIAGARVEELRASEDAGFRWVAADIARAITRVRPKLAFLCNPNNPTGALLPAGGIQQLLAACDETLLVVDEAYLPFCDAPVELMPLISSGRLLLLRSMTKDYGLAGLRLGYAVAPPEVVEDLNRVRPPWSVSAAAQAAGLAALSDGSHLEAARRTVTESRAYLVRALSDLGLRVVPPTANFLLVKVGNGAVFRSALLVRGVCVRDCASFDLPEYVRIGVRTMADCRRLVEAVGEVVARG